MNFKKKLTPSKTFFYMQYSIAYRYVLIFNVSNMRKKKDFEKFLILCMVVIFPLRILSRADKVILGIAHPAQ